MTTLRFEQKTVRGAHLGGVSPLPAMRNGADTRLETRLDEDDGLFVGYGRLRNILPYQMQDRYDRALEPMTLETAVLENDWLRAEFVPGLGGRLWSLYDKAAGRDLVSCNPVFRPGNLALRDAWFCGGVEWNIGMTGHSPFTCSPLFVSRLVAQDGTPVLRMYEFERVRCCIWQMDFFLPEDSHFLFARMRIVNPGDEVQPMYWWSNIAVPEEPGSRVIVPAKETYTNAYVEENRRALTKIPVPDGAEGFDLTYPAENPIAVDYFFKIPPEKRKFETQLNPQGYGLVHTSTDRQQGRKLFVWGQGPGGRRWQEFLTSEEGHPYQEMQAGLAHTQMECLPMPPHTAWEWMEAYGPLQIDGSAVNGPWDQAVLACEQALETALPRKKLEQLLTETRQDFALRPGQPVSAGSGWGALENCRRQAEGQPPISSHLDFGQPGAAQQPWLQLLESGCLPDQAPMETPPSYLVQEEWFRKLREASEGPGLGNWMVWMQLGLCWYWRDDMERAEEAFSRSLTLAESPWALYGLANTMRSTGRLAAAARTMARASAMLPDELSLAKEALATLSEAEDWRGITALVSRLSAKIYLGKVKFYHAEALAHLGELDRAREILLADGGLEIPDVREGEVSTSSLWVWIALQQAAKDGVALSADDVEIPPQLDFRMNVSKQDVKK